MRWRLCSASIPVLPPRPGVFRSGSHADRKAMSHRFCFWRIRASRCTHHRTSQPVGPAHRLVLSPVSVVVVGVWWSTCSGAWLVLPTWRARWKSAFAEDSSSRRERNSSHTGTSWRDSAREGRWCVSVGRIAAAVSSRDASGALGSPNSSRTSRTTHHRTEQLADHPTLVAHIERTLDRRSSYKQQREPSADRANTELDQHRPSADHLTGAQPLEHSRSEGSGKEPSSCSCSDLSRFHLSSCPCDRPLSTVCLSRLAFVDRPAAPSPCSRRLLCLPRRPSPRRRRRSSSWYSSARRSRRLPRRRRRRASTSDGRRTSSRSTNSRTRGNRRVSSEGGPGGDGNWRTDEVVWSFFRRVLLT